MSSKTITFKKLMENLRVPFGGTSHGFNNRKSTAFRHADEVRNISSYRERTYNFSRSIDNQPTATGRKRFVRTIIEGKLCINRIN